MPTGQAARRQGLRLPPLPPLPDPSWYQVRIARRGIEGKSSLGRGRWGVKHTISWLLRFKRLGLRYDRTERTTLALLTLACTVINLRRLIKIELCDQV